MKKIIVPVLFLFASIALAGGAKAGWGVGLDAGFWTADADEFKKDMRNLRNEAADLGDGFSGKTTQYRLNPGLHFFYERPLNSEWDLGASLGYGKAAPAEYSYRYDDAATPANSYSAKFENTAYAAPFSLYAKFKKGKTNLFGGAGLDYISTKLKADVAGAAAESGSFEDNKLIPNVSAGGEYFVAKNFSVGLNLKYLFAGKMDNFRGNYSTASGKQKLIMATDPYGEYMDFIPESQALSSGQRRFKYDFSGLRINLAARYYFGG